jgi:hypothetical protein
VKGWAETWLKSCRADNLSITRHYEARLRLYILPVIGSMRLDAVRVEHIYDILTRAKERGDLASRTVRHIYFTAAAMFGAAVERDLILASPCKIRRGKLPEKVDKDPRWRVTAVHTREELEAMISDPRLPGWRRVFWALLFLAGARFGRAPNPGL